jgi:hypothetical protein
MTKPACLVGLLAFFVLAADTLAEVDFWQANVP